MSELAYVAVCDDVQCGKCYKCKNAELKAEKRAAEAEAGRQICLNTELEAENREERALSERLDKANIRKADKLTALEAENKALQTVINEVAREANRGMIATLSLNAVIAIDNLKDAALLGVQK